MPTCTNCENEWSWKQALRRSFTLKPGMSCPFCGEKQYVSRRTQNKTVALNFIPLTLIMFVSIYFGFSLITFPLLLGIVPLFLSLYPFWMELTSEEQYFFK